MWEKRRTHGKGKEGDKEGRQQQSLELGGGTRPREDGIRVAKDKAVCKILGPTGGRGFLGKRTARDPSRKKKLWC